MVSVYDIIQSVGVVPVIKIDSPDQAFPLGKALLAGGLPIAEVTFRTAAGEEGIRILRNELPELLVGAGTIVSVSAAKRAQKAGAQFIVSPGYSDDIVAFCQEQDIPVFPGVNNPSQIQQALERDLSVVKFFPAEASGGIPMLQALSAPFPTMKFMPTGGIGIHNLGDYLKKPYIVACGGSWMVPGSHIKEQKWDEIARLSKEAVHAVHGFSFAHLGINQAHEQEAKSTAETLATILQPISEKPNSFFSSNSVEIMKQPYLGTHGHIGIYTWNVERALKYLTLFGFEGVKESERRDPDGTLHFIYLKPEVGGFALHIMRA